MENNENQLPVPLERLTLPIALDGSNGNNRAAADVRKQINAENDIEAVKCWLAEFHDSPHTFRNYRKEVERLLVWAITELEKPLSSLGREDLSRYEAFLADPQPRDRWCGPRTSRDSSAWRPFEGPLTPTSRRQVLIILNSMFGYLVAAGYLASNPIALIRRRTRITKPTVTTVERFLEHDLWQYVLQFVDSMPRETPGERARQERARFLFCLLYLLGPRVSEVASHTMGSFVERRGKWWWKVTGKGEKEAQIPVNQEMLAALERYRTFLGLSALPEPEEITPLVPTVGGTRPVTANMVYRIVKDVLDRAAAAIEPQEPHKASKLRKASTHWLRHTAVTHQADAGIELRYLNKSARHAKLETTSIYLHADDDAWSVSSRSRMRRKSASSRAGRSSANSPAV
ncbi:MAG: integrase [Candidatus Muproteobacteria bacterium RBG_16_60_9]|uniref:Integrase n=1 Tax=Candidatus Muproteobacteria bacterium RBG_16_60_9 TaxID=1817755 RepID=A0A1F6UWR9_9PROT|nr:MAG: integrase [Candidatus Muproteobacteria bacterium RBG_16_60_9]